MLKIRWSRQMVRQRMMRILSYCRKREENGELRGSSGPNVGMEFGIEDKISGALQAPKSHQGLTVRRKPPSQSSGDTYTSIRYVAHLLTSRPAAQRCTALRPFVQHHSTDSVRSSSQGCCLESLRDWQSQISAENAEEKSPWWAS